MTELDNVTNRTNLHPIILLLVIIFGAISLATDRKYALIPTMLVQSFITTVQRISLVGMDFSIMRIMFCILALRIILRREYVYIKFTTLDYVLLAYVVVAIAAFTLQEPSMTSFIYTFGVAIDTIGGYFIVRILVRDEKDILTIVKTLMYISFFLWFPFIYESKKGINLLNLFGGLRITSQIREGRIRAQGAYSHAILAGSFWAACIPLFSGYLRENRRKYFGMLFAILSGLVIIFMCASSTPIMSLLIGIIAMVIFYQRESLSGMKLLIITGILGLMVFWQKPIWYLFAKIDVAGGSTGFFRYLLVDRFIRNWREWIFIGLRDTYHWGEGLMLAAAGLSDIPNQFVLEGVRGGFGGFALFITAIIIAYNYLGKMIRISELDTERARYWQIGVSMLVHIFNFLGVSYFGQVRFLWWMTIAFVVCLYQNKIQSRDNGLSGVDASLKTRQTV